MRMPAWRPLAATLLCASCAAPCAAQDAHALYRQALAATCASCHGTSGRAVEAAAVPGLAGMPASYMVEQLRAFRTGARPATVMHQIAKGFSEAQLDAIAAYFAAQRK